MHLKIAWLNTRFGCFARTWSRVRRENLLSWLHHALALGTVGMVPACTPSAFWRSSETSTLSSPAPVVVTVETLGPASREADSSHRVNNAITPATAEISRTIKTQPTEHIEPPPLLPTPNQVPRLEPHTLPQEILFDPEPAPAPRSIDATSAEDDVPLCTALRAYLRGETESAVERLRAYEERDQQFLLRLFPVLAQLHHAGLYAASLSPPQRQVLLEALRGLSHDLRTQAPLQIRRIAFCRKVLGYGKFEPTSARFSPGEAVGLYCEVENLQDQQFGCDQFGLTVDGQLELRNAWGKTVWQQEVQFEPDLACSPRQDHFFFIRWRLPDSLDEGHYHLCFTLRDLATQRSCVAEVPLQVARCTGR
ncbi:MAG: hypothetical protein RMI91_06465 [Gemmatales bacterium]|nr:hypothetical protein [Gemmatales bacterium]MDW7994279.1 hypothetical protein [Gemmatales bacterium]